MKAAWLVLASFLAWSAGCKPASPAADAGAEEEAPPEYEGEAMSGAIPVVEDNTPAFQEVDAGEFTVDRRCCHLSFSIADQEPSASSGAIYGSFGVFAVDGGLPLTRGSGEWRATACFPLNTSAEYAYVFSTPFVAEDGGTDDAGVSDDGGMPGPTVTARASDREARQSDGMGGFVNIIPSAANCEALDASVGMLP